MFAEHFFASIFFFPPFAVGLRKASIMCAVFFFPGPFSLGTKTVFSGGGEGRRKRK